MKKEVSNRSYNFLTRFLKRGTLAIICLASLTLVSTSWSQAGIEPEQLSTPLKCNGLKDVDSTFTLFDNQSYTSDGTLQGSYSGLGYVEYSIRNTLFLKIDDASDSCISDTFAVSFKVLLTGKDKNGMSFTDTIDLHVNYNPALGQLDTSQASYVFYDQLWTQAKVIQIYDTDTNSLQFVYIGLSLNIERYRALDGNDTISMLPHNTVSGTEEIRFMWDTIGGAESYEFEWTWVDAFDDDGAVKAETEVEVSFRHNSTLVEIIGNEYSISPAYESGYIVVRVRPVGVNKYKPEQLVYGDWSNHAYSEFLSSYDSVDYVLVKTGTDYEPLDQGMNWQYAATFAEEGKRKEVISYYDGSLRTRQSVTRISTIMQSVVGETVYDYEGRPAVNILPVPAFDQTLRFHPAFNLSNVSNVTYHKNDFDSLTTASCGVTVSALKTSKGASKYYSDQNDSVSSREFGFIPDAHGYPMTVTEYMADGTGRIKRQGGVGQDHQLGTDHETKYFYATPGEQELDRLFGNAVGEYVHYQKEMVIDPNGQVSVSYKDLSGKVIATSLAGDSPDSMATLSSESGATDTLTQYALSIYYEPNGVIQADKVFPVSSDSTLYRISYDLEIPRYKLDSFPTLCFDCVYELEISLQDDCDQEYLDGDPNTGGNQPIYRLVGMVGEDFDLSCDSSVLTYNFTLDDTINAEFISVYLDIGRYTLHKSLKISANAYEYYWKRLVNSPGIKTLEEFEEEAIAEQDTSVCSWDCDECLSNLGTYSAFYTTRSNELITIGYEGDVIDEMVQAEWDQMVVQCSTLCLEPNTRCQVIYNALLADVMPGGQYFPVKDTGTGALPLTGLFDTTISNIIGFSYKKYDDGGWNDITYLDGNGDTIKVLYQGDSVTPGELTPTEFYRMYDLEWSYSLVQFHPEYCKYVFCDTNSGTYDFNDGMDTVHTFNEAYALGYFDPINNDTFFTNPYHSGYATTFESARLNRYLNSYGTDQSGQCISDYSILDIAFLINYTDQSFANCMDISDFLNSVIPIDTTTLCQERADAVWQTFRGIYQSEKQEFFDSLQCNPSIPTGYERRFKSSDDLTDSTYFDDTETNVSVLSNDANDSIVSGCDTICGSQAEYWLSKLGGCNLPDTIQDSLMQTFVKICKNSCGPNHPWGATDHPVSVSQRFSTPFISFEQAFNAIVPDSLKSPGSCDPWTISFPPSYNHTFAKLAGIDSACIESSFESDTCYTQSSEDMQDYMEFSKMADTSTTCEDCIDCDEFMVAWDSLSSRYDGLFIDSTWELKQVLTNYFNAYFGFNLDYWDYHDFAEECTAFGDRNYLDYTDIEDEEIDISLADPFGLESLIRQYNPRFERPDVRWPDKDGNTDWMYASNGDMLFPFATFNQQVQTTDTTYIDTCVCNELAELLEDFGLLNPLEKDSIINGSATDHSFDLFAIYTGCEGYEVEAMLLCLDVFETYQGLTLSSSGGWSELASEALATNVMNYDNGIGMFLVDCLADSCGGDHPGQSNPFYSEAPGSHPGNFFDWPGKSLVSGPDCDSLEQSILEVLYNAFPGDTAIDTSEWTNFQDCFYTSICQVMNSNEQWLCQNCSSTDTLWGGDSIRSLYDSVWVNFSNNYNAIWESSWYASATGIEQGDSIVPAEDTLEPEQKMRLLMQHHGKCVVLPCNYCYPPECDTCSSGGIISGPDYTCCKDTTVYFTKLQAFFEDFTDSAGTLGNYFAYPGWGAYPNNIGYYGSPLYQGNCHTDIRYRLINNRMPVLNFVMEDDCGDEFYVNLGYLDNYGNEANFGKITEIIDIQILPEPEPSSCIGSNRFAILAKQVKDNLDTMEIELIGVISKYEVYTSRVTYLQTCDGPQLCNRPYGTIIRNMADPCVAEKIIRARSIARIRYDNYIDSLKRDFKNQYWSKCMTAVDTVEMDYEIKEYHYTLYYYDQAGNLIQTVPPAGVNMITLDSDLAQIKAYRESGTGSPLYDSHTLKTLYRYNTLNEVTWQYTPDGDTSMFWYDRLGRMAVSQNAEQRDGANDNYSYTEYDDLGRIVEVGQIHNAQGMTVATAFDTSSLSTWMGNGTKSQITHTWYDASPADLSSEGFDHGNLRSRVSAMAFYESADSGYDHAVFYDYDIHGNVENLMREITDLHFIEQGYKMISYDYDLVSGNVNKVHYQSDQFDQFTHSYLYDADNRIEDVYNSVDQVHWDKDAHYQYSWHGPLRRMELGHLRVQGVDYAYSIHGWLKGVNQNNLGDAKYDIGRDGDAAYALNATTGKDVFGFSLHYYNGDYDPINNLDNYNSGADYFLMDDASSTFEASVRSLFNGNISRMVTTLEPLDESVSGRTVGKAYEYDQLNRISSSLTFTNYSESSHSWTASSGGNSYETDYTYDANGNILSLRRSDEYGSDIDYLTYHYTGGTNQLTYVDDTVGDCKYDYDIDDQSSGNYLYDRIGNLVSDTAEEIANIEWTVYGKIKSITRLSGSSKPNLSFEYTPDGHRVAKHVTDSLGNTKSTWYIRDASGNIMATYSRDWDVVLDTSTLTEIELYEILKGSKSFESLLTYFDESFDWNSYVSNRQLDSLEAGINIDTAQQHDFLDNFGAIDFLTASTVDSIIEHMSDTAFVSLLRTNINDGNIADMLCDSCAEDWFEAMMDHDYSGFLTSLAGFDMILFDSICIELSISTMPPAEERISEIQDSSTAANTASIIVGKLYSCETMKNILDDMVTLNSSGAKDFFATVTGFKTCIQSHVDTVSMKEYTGDYLSNGDLWDEIFTYESTTEDEKVAYLRDSSQRAFLFFSVRELGDTLMDSVVYDFDSSHVGLWLETIQAHYGMDFYNYVLQQLLPDNNNSYWSYSLEEHHIYGSSRLGIKKRDLKLFEQIQTPGTSNYLSTQGDSLIQYFFQDSTKYLLRGAVRYELSNHLGNVLAVVTDRKLQVCNSGDVTSYEAQVVMVNDYYPFGMLMENRTWSATSTTDTLTVVEEALDLDSTEARIDLEKTSVIGDEITVEFWFNRDTVLPGVTEMLYDDYHGNSLGVLVYIQNQKLTFYGRNDGGGGVYYYHASDTIFDGQWHHAAMTVSGSTWNYYIDGELAGTKTGPSGTTSFGNSGRARVGARNAADPATYTYSGAIKHVGLWSVARNENQIASSFTDKEILATCGLVGYWKLTEGGGNVVANSVNGNLDTADADLYWTTHSFNKLVSSSQSYRFAFNGYERDDEVKGEGNSYDFGARIYDSRLGRFLSRDPLEAKYLWQSPYAFAGNSPISFIDENGMGPVLVLASPEQTKKVKAALDNNNYAEVYRILYYAANHGFVDEQGKPSDYMSKQLVNQGLKVVEGTTLAVSDISATTAEGIKLEGVVENSDGTYSKVDLGRLEDPLGLDIPQSVAIKPDELVNAIIDEYTDQLDRVNGSIAAIEAEITKIEKEIDWVSGFRDNAANQSGSGSLSRGKGLKNEGFRDGEWGATAGHAFTAYRTSKKIDGLYEQIDDLEKQLRRELRPQQKELKAKIGTIKREWKSNTGRIKINDPIMEKDNTGSGANVNIYEDE